MKTMYKYFCLLFLLTSFAQIDGKEERQVAEDFSIMSAQELDSAFIAAIKNDQPDKVKKLIEAGANIHQKISYVTYLNDWDYMDTCTALQYAARHGFEEILKVLMQENYEMEDIHAVLIPAAGHGLEEIVKAVMQKNPPINYINTAIIFAAKNGHITVIKELLKASDINAVGDEALIAAIENGRLDTVKELIQDGANVNHVDKYGKTPLIIAVAQDYSWKKKEEIIQTLLNAGANVNHADNNGNTALMEAIEEHDLNTVKKLLSTPGIDVNQANNNGDTAVIIAIKYTQYTYVVGNKHQYDNCVNSQDVLTEIVETPGVDFYHSNKNGDTAIELLIELTSKMLS